MCFSFFNSFDMKMLKIKKIIEFLAFLDRI